ncbi:MAG TPA: homoserine dehydrogenase [Ignavibacteriaceae bacterium]|nr:homoserine dehydrogenase [Ignavibacteriaceae bacterium]
MNRNKIKIGLFGFGCVGKGLYSVLEKTHGLKVEIAKICVKDENKSRTIDEKYFTYDKDELLEDPDVNVIVELIDNSADAFDIVSKGLKNGKAVVTANKKMVSENLEELICLQTETKTPLLYEAACCASIPLIRNFEEYYDNDLMQSFSGIMNGTTNFILTDIFRNRKKYDEALGFAKLHGYSESNPVLDVEGYDSKYKLSILLTHAFGLIIKPEDIFNLGIQRINKFDIQFAREKGAKIKLIARAQKLNNGGIAAFVLPEFIYANNELSTVDGVDNGIVTENYFADRNIFIGKGAGAVPTAAAVLSDLSALTYNYKYEYKKKLQANGTFHDMDFFIDIYLRFNRDTDIYLTEFEELYEKYDSRVYSYITGKINFRKFISSDWIKNENVNVILLNNKIEKIN